MEIADLHARKAQLDSTILQLASQWQTCQGHLAEVNYWIAEHEKAQSDSGVAPEDQAVVE